MGIIGWVLLGLGAGLLAKAIFPGSKEGGLVVTTLVGIAGALAGGFIVRALGFGNPIDEFFDISTWLAAIGGAGLLLYVWSMVSGGSRGVTAH